LHTFDIPFQHSPERHDIGPRLEVIRGIASSVIFPAILPLCATLSGAGSPWRAFARVSFQTPPCVRPRYHPWCRSLDLSCRNRPPEKYDTLAAATLQGPPGLFVTFWRGKLLAQRRRNDSFSATAIPKQHSQADCQAGFPQLSPVW